ncbi:MAG TPA: tyrosine protein phosphatase, partial [Erythrobacter sp.]|nr:tyrosine protein phosphatase [Erythrobacter sp.]
GLPVDDIEDDGRAFFAFHHAGRCIGFGGIEGDGRDRILRSVVILGA